MQDILLKNVRRKQMDQSNGWILLAACIADKTPQEVADKVIS
jgi:hypothetical protein